MKEGDVILTPVPQADGKLKERPAIFLREMPPYRDLLVCGVSTQLHRHVKDFDELLSPADGDFKASCIRKKITDSTRLFSCITALSCAWFNWFHLS